MNELALFAGYGGGILGGCLLGWRTVCAVEIDDKARQRLMDRQDDGSLRAFPIWDDVRTFDGKPWSGRVDVVSGGFPCTDISVAGKGAGITGKESGLWREFARIIREVRPRYVLVENSPALVARGLGTVLGDLAEMGFDARWGVFGADEAALATHCGEIPLIHNRDRIWIVGFQQGTDPNGLRELQPERIQSDIWRRAGDVGKTTTGDAHGSRPQSHGTIGAESKITMLGGNGEMAERQPATWWSTEPDVDRVVHGVANRVDRLRGLGNGQVPAVVALAWETLTWGYPLDTSGWLVADDVA
jgi:DNA (cytosine-5)-methyltransferase 1